MAIGVGIEDEMTIMTIALINDNNDNSINK
jgi:hypothetical protein